MRVLLYSLLLCLSTLSPLGAMIKITLDYGSTAQQDIDDYGAAFEAAENFWESRLLGYRDSGSNAPSQVLINVALAPNDGPGGVLGSAGLFSGNFGGNFLETTEGNMSFDNEDIGSLQTNGSLSAVIRHEMAHVLGFGTLWSGFAASGVTGFQEVYTDGTGEYTGAAALAAFQDEFNQPGATFVPVELDGGLGTANGHWNMGINLGEQEVADSRDDPGDAIVYTSVNNGLTLDNELMTGFLTAPAWLSNTTLQSFYDIGYEVVPEPGAFALIAGILALGSGLSRRRSGTVG